MVSKDCTVVLSSHVLVSLSTVVCTSDSTIPSSQSCLETMHLYSCPLFLAGLSLLLLVSCPTQLTPSVVV